MMEMIMARISVNPFCSVANSFAADLDMWATLGVTDVGVSSVKTAGLAPAQLADELGAASLTAAYVVHSVGCAVNDEPAWADEQRLLLRCVELAQVTGARTIYFAPGPQGGLRWDEAVTLLTERLAPVRDAAGSLGIELAIETVHSSRPEIGFVRTVHDAVLAARTAGVGVCLDLYVSWADRDLAALVRDNLDVIHLVQVSDFRIGDRCQPARRVPGDGDLPLARVVADLRAAGYDGYFDLELLGPAIEAEGYASAASRGLAWLQTQLT
jgi:sugar phosphate isomerase/epimerase